MWAKVLFLLLFGFFQTTNSAKYDVVAEELTYQGTSSPGFPSGFKIYGASPANSLGYSVSGIGDINNDSYADIIIGAPNVDNNGKIGVGASYVVLGHNNDQENYSYDTIDCSALSASRRVYTVLGSENFDANSRSGQAVSNAGDINGDSFDDYIIAAPGFSNSVGRVYVLYGSNKTSPLDVIDITSIPANNEGHTGFRISSYAVEPNLLGFSVSAAGDFNGDGFADFVVSVPGVMDNQMAITGAAYLVLGSATLADFMIEDITSNSANGIFIIGGSSNNDGDGAGYVVRSAGDLNGDGYDDILVGAPSVIYSSNLCGAVYVIYGRDSSTGSFSDIDLNNYFDHVILGKDGNIRIGYSISGIGDFNGDGLDDFMIGSGDVETSYGPSTGVVYVIYGNTGFNGFVELVSFVTGPNTGFRIRGGFESRAGGTLAGGGDINGDGLADILVGGAMRVYAIYGQVGERSDIYLFGFVSGTEGFISMWNFQAPRMEAP